MKLILMTLLIFLGCANGPLDVVDETPASITPAELAYDNERGVEYMDGNCQHMAVFAAAAAISYGYEYEGVLGNQINQTTGVSEYHLNVRVLKDGVWYWAFVRDRRRVELWEHFGGWNQNNNITFQPDENEAPMNLDKIIYHIKFDWWDAFRD